MCATSTTFCAIPWIHRQTDEQGFHQLCCVAAGEGNTLRNAHGERLHISQQLTDEQVLNSPGVKLVRRQMMRGEWPAACERCRQSEEAGSSSIRMLLNRQFGEDREILLGQTRPDGTIDHPGVRYADIRLGNACNLTCRMCGPAASRLWAAYFNDVQPAAYRLPAGQLHILGENNWVKREPLAWLLEQCLPSVERLHFAGGEPLIVPEMVDALQQCVASGRANQIELSYNTNVTVLPEKVTALWPHFRSVSLLCSVDGYGRLNDYIRRPSCWSDIDRNLRTIDRRSKEWKVHWAAISTTARSTMVFLDAADKSANLPEFFSFCEASDQAFGDSWPEAAPELAEHLEPVRQELSRRASRLAIQVKSMMSRES